MHFAHKKNDNLYFSEGYLKASVPLLSQLKQLKPRRIYYMSIFHFFLPLLSERENYKRFTTSLLWRVGKAYTQSFNLDLGSFHTIASGALKWRESEGRLSFNEERSKKCSTFQIFLRQYHMTWQNLFHWWGQYFSGFPKKHISRNIARALHCPSLNVNIFHQCLNLSFSTVSQNHTNTKGSQQSGFFPWRGWGGNARK